MQRPILLALGTAVGLALVGAGLFAHATFTEARGQAAEAACRATHEGLAALECMDFSGIGAGIERAWAAGFIGAGALVAGIAVVMRAAERPAG